VKRISFVTTIFVAFMLSFSSTAKETPLVLLPCQVLIKTIDGSDLSTEEKLSKFTAFLDGHITKPDLDVGEILCAYQQLFLIYTSIRRDHEIKKLYEDSSFLQTFVATNENINSYAPPILRVANAYLVLKEFNNAKNLINKIQPYLSQNDMSELNKYWFHMAMGQLYVMTNEYKDGMTSFRIALKLIENSDDVSDSDRLNKTARINQYIGNTYSELGDYKNAIKQYQINNSFGNLNNIAFSQLKLSEWELALNTAKAASKEALRLGNSLYWAYANIVIARAKHELGQNVEAIKIIKKPIFTLRILNHTSGTIEALVVLAEFHISLDQWEAAETAMLEANQLLVSATTNIELEENFFETNFLIEERKHNYKEALEFYKQMLIIKEESFELLQKQISQRLMLDYELEIAQETMLRLEQENKLASIMLQNNERKNQLLISVIVGTSAVLLLLFYVYLREHKSKLEMSHLAMTDHLTGCPNRRHSLKQAKGMLSSPNDIKNSMIIAILDVDNFKVVNDTHGHDVGDQVLQNLSSIIKGVLREDDVIGRYGGEEFILLLPNADEQEITRIFSRIQIALQHHVCEYNGEHMAMPLSVSMGAVIATDTPNSAEEQENSLLLDKIIKQADEKAYEAKEGGKNQLVCVTMSLRS
jgi:diguanylate cyclase (GGDEF)-like protein